MFFCFNSSNSYSSSSFSDISRDLCRDMEIGSRVWSCRDVCWSATCSNRALHFLGSLSMVVFSFCRVSDVNAAENDKKSTCFYPCVVKKLVKCKPDSHQGFHTTIEEKKSLFLFNFKCKTNFVLDVYFEYQKSYANLSIDYSISCKILLTFIDHNYFRFTNQNW